jgi:hypothetical protein
MPATNDLTEVASNRELRRRRWLHGIEHLVPQMLAKAEQAGGIVAGHLGHKRLPDDRIVKFTREAKLVHQGTGGAHQGC